MIGDTITDKFKYITGYDIKLFFSDYVTYVSTYYKDVVSYYRDGIDANGTAFDYLDYLLAQSGELEGVIVANGFVFDNAEYWDLMDHVSTIQVNLDTMVNLSRWLRSSRTDRYSSGVKLDYVQKQLESFEDISKKTGSIDSENDWIDLAIRNNRHEESYTSAGGSIISVDLSNNMTFDIKNIVDNLSADNLYGKDMQKKFEITDSDIVTLVGLDSLMQTFGTILDTFKGSIPEFPDDGFDPEIIGSNVNTVNYPSIFRNLLNMFAKDDRFSSVDLLDLYRADDNIFMKLQANTRMGDKMLNDIRL